ncbi:MAG: aminoacyl-tRNA deacylase [Clostridia bacterium]|nr:aminoacyl-tRNA deacylase [Clostridia bacterium]
MGSNKDKTNVMRILDQKKVIYRHCFYDDAIVNALDAAALMGKNPAEVFKTLVTVGRSRAHYVFMVPANKELDFKKAASAAGEKSLEMIPQSELLPLTGYIHGGCSPIGMKKAFKTFIDQSADSIDVISFSGGRTGSQVQMPLQELQKILPVTLAEL